MPRNLARVRRVLAALGLPDPAAVIAAHRAGLPLARDVLRAAIAARGATRHWLPPVARRPGRRIDERWHRLAVTAGAAILATPDRPGRYVRSAMVPHGELRRLDAALRDVGYRTDRARALMRGRA